MKIRLDARVRDEYDGKEIYQRNLKTSGPAEATRGSRSVRAFMDMRLA